MRMRTISEAAACIVAEDPATALTKTAVRRLVVTGAVPSVRVGNKYLVDVDGLQTYLTGGSAQQPEADSPARGIRRVEV